MNFGDKSPELLDLHNFLIANGFLDTRESFYSIKTFNAVKKLQEYLGVEATGEFDESLYSLYEIKNLDSISSYSTRSINRSSSNVSTTDSVISTDNATQQQQFREQDADLSGLIFPAYIQNMLTGTTIKIPVTIEELNWSKGNNFAETETKGRSAAYHGYSNSSSKSLDFSFTIHKDLLIGETLESYCNKLEALAYPRYGSYTVPPKAFFRCGTVRLEGFVSEVSVALMPPIIDGAYSVATISVNMVETYAVGMSATTIEAGEK